MFNKRLKSFLIHREHVVIAILKNELIIKKTENN